LAAAPSDAAVEGFGKSSAFAQATSARFSLAAARRETEWRAQGPCQAGVGLVLCMAWIAQVFAPSPTSGTPSIVPAAFWSACCWSWRRSFGGH
jgi:hypothetical protein